MRHDLGAGIDPGSEMDTPHSKKSRVRANQGRAKNKSTKAKGKQKASQVTPTPAPTPAAAPPTPALQTAPTHVVVPAAAAAAAASTTRHSYALPNPNVHHRHRPIPLFAGPTASARSQTATTTVRVERLRRPPRLFAPNETTATNAYASAPSITRRVGKAWSASVGAGPVWQVVEDLGWFAEAERFFRLDGTAHGRAASESESGLASASTSARQVIVCDERARRPRVHADVALLEGWSVFRGVECVLLPSSSPVPIFFPRFLHIKPCVGFLRLIDFVLAFCSEMMRSRICPPIKEAAVPTCLRLLLLLLHRRYLVTLVRSESRRG
jgi:hypothetical protein